MKLTPKSSQYFLQSAQAKIARFEGQMVKMDKFISYHPNEILIATSLIYLKKYGKKSF